MGAIARPHWLSMETTPIFKLVKHFLEKVIRGVSPIELAQLLNRISFASNFVNFLVFP
jgi:hypothetical protein